MLTVLLLICSNAFMTIAWYGHLRFKAAPLAIAIIASWLIALPEYALQVPANRWGHSGRFSAPELKILQEVITISVFVIFNYLYLREQVRPTDWAAFVLIIAAVAVMMYPRARADASPNNRVTSTQQAAHAGSTVPAAAGRASQDIRQAG